MKYTQKQLKALEEQGLLHLAHIAQKNNPAQSLGQPMHGPNGPFSEPGVNPGVFNAITAPRTFADTIPLRRSEYFNELTSILTALTATGGSNPTDVCGTAPVVGQLKKATVQTQFGQLYLSSEKVNVTRVGELNNRADVERRILNMAQTPDPLAPDVLRMSGLNFRSERTHQMYKLYQGIRRAVAPVNVTGNATLANSATQLGFIKEFDGLDRLIKTGYTDVSTGVAAPAADSLVVNWGANVNGSKTIQGNSLDISQILHDMYYSRSTLASQLGGDGAWGFVMDQRLFREVVFAFARTYASIRGGGQSAGNPTFRDSERLESRAQEMMRGQYLLIDGMPVPVYFTSGAEVAVDDLSGAGLVGDIWLVNYSFAGEDTLYYEYFPMNNQFAVEWARSLGAEYFDYSNDGLYIYGSNVQNFCGELITSARMRLIHRTPFLSAKLTNITFNSYVGYRDFEVGSTFYYGGGATVYTGTA